MAPRSESFMLSAPSTIPSSRYLSIMHSSARHYHAQWYACTVHVFTTCRCTVASFIFLEWKLRHIHRRYRGTIERHNRVFIGYMWTLRKTLSSDDRFFSRYLGNLRFVTAQKVALLGAIHDTIDDWQIERGKSKDVLETSSSREHFFKQCKSLRSIIIAMSVCVLIRII